MHFPVDVVFLIGQLPVGGTEQQLLLLLKNLDRSKFRPTVVCLSEEAALAASLEQLDCPTFVLGRPKEGRLKTLFRVCLLMRRLRPSILHSFAFAGRAGVLASVVSGLPSSVISFRTYPHWTSLWGRLLDWLVISSADLLLTNSQRALSTLRSERLIGRSLSRVIYNGIDLQRFDQLLTKPPFCPPHNGRGESFPESTPAICVVGTLRPVKELENLLKAFAIVLTSTPNACLWVVGDGPVRANLQGLARDLDLDGHVEFMGMQSNVPAILQEAAIGVNSSRIEGLCNAIIEYMAAGLPVVATNVGGNPELVLHGETGLLVPPGDPQALAGAILYLLAHPNVARRFGEAARRRVEKYFTAERMVKETEAIYQELLSQDGFSARTNDHQ